MSSKSLIDRVIDLEAGSVKAKKSKVCDPNLSLFSDDEFRYKAFRWYCLKNIVLKVSAILISGTALGGSLIEIIRNALG